MYSTQPSSRPRSNASRWLGLTLAAALLFGCGSAAEEEIEETAALSAPTQSDITVAASADSYVHAAYPSHDHGTQSFLRARKDAHIAFIRFEVPTLPGRVARALLQLYVQDGSDDSGAVRSASNDWTEEGLTFSHMPAVGGVPLASLGPVLDRGWVEADVSTAVTGPGLVSFALSSASLNSSYYSSREGVAPPRLGLILDAGPAPEPSPPPSPSAGVLFTPSEITALPMSGSGWKAVEAAALGSWGNAAIADQESMHDVKTYAGALYAMRTGNAAMRARVAAAIESAIGTEAGGRTLALGRNLLSYVLAADLIGHRTARFTAWLDRVRTEKLSGRTLISTHEDRPNNWGTHAGASRIAAARFLNDSADLRRAAEVFRGYLGDRDAWTGFAYGDLSWQADPSRPVGINPAGSTRNGHSIDGVLPDDQRRAGGFTWPPPKENYVWEALQGASVQAELLTRAGYPAWSWSDRALLRAVRWLHQEAGFAAQGDDTWIPWLVNKAYGTTFPAPSPSRPGKNIGFTDWTHAR